MKNILILLTLFSIQMSMAQPLVKVENHTLNAMDLVLFSFGMDQPISIGTISNTGELHFNFPKDYNFLTDEVTANYMNDAAYTLFSKCDNFYDMLSEDENIKSAVGGYISLSSKDNPYEGLLFMVTDENMVPWLESDGAIDAILGSYFELVYVESEFNYQGDCSATVTYTDDDPLVTTYSYNLHLNPGFNFIEYKIESVEEQNIPSMYEENKIDKIKKPTKIAVSSSQSSAPNAKWIGKYFYN
ncbi:hypothetical protein ES711_03780 [Gelidibacter salicanalis]|uniref:GLPGLI family protein n=1 Tax=Gelidibacter salicanalis TaxID=291193 RepID=A0A5C7ARF0_9FLAO|nr:hypothetical protein [Gelidibacter salicanalis]TXE09065.1 hypothetical protein ES711_03780 [Gelidibacter salicanalis]